MARRDSRRGAVRHGTVLHGAAGNGAVGNGAVGNGAPEGAEYGHERPQDWGWHAELGKWARLAGWVSIVAILLLNFTTHYNNAQDVWLYGVAGVLLLALLRDWYVRRNAWRAD